MLNQNHYLFSPSSKSLYIHIYNITQGPPIFIVQDRHGIILRIGTIPKRRIACEPHVEVRMGPVHCFFRRHFQATRRDQMQAAVQSRIHHKLHHAIAFPCLPTILVSEHKAANEVLTLFLLQLAESFLHGGFDLYCYLYARQPPMIQRDVCLDPLAAEFLRRGPSKT